MKIKSTITVAIALLFTVLTSAQSVTLSLQVIALPKIDLGSLIVSKDLSGTPRIFSLSMAPADIPVYLTGEIYWQDLNSTEFLKISSFVTKPFSSKSVIYNNEIGSGLYEIQNDETNTDLVDIIVKKGTPTGRFRLVFSLFDPETKSLLAGPVSEILEFLNPTQTITLTSPSEGSTVPDNWNISWTPVIGAKYYKLTLSEVLPNQVPEDALRSGTPLIAGKNVGTATAAGIRNNLEREPSYNNPVAAMVEAVIEGPGGEEFLKSTPVVFTLNSSISAIPSFQVVQALNGITVADFTNPQFTVIINGLLNGSVQLLGVTDEFGNPLDQSDILQIMNMLNSNPDSVVGVTIQ